jgi:hypothetical protein
LFQWFRISRPCPLRRSLVLSMSSICKDKSEQLICIEVTALPLCLHE